MKSTSCYIRTSDRGRYSHSLYCICSFEIPKGDLNHSSPRSTCMKSTSCYSRARDRGRYSPCAVFNFTQNGAYTPLIDAEPTPEQRLAANARLQQVLAQMDKNALGTFWQLRGFRHRFTLVMANFD